MWSRPGLSRPGMLARLAKQQNFWSCELLSSEQIMLLEMCSNLKRKPSFQNCTILPRKVLFRTCSGTTPENAKPENQQHDEDYSLSCVKLFERLQDPS